MTPNPILTQLTEEIVDRLPRASHSDDVWDSATRLIMLEDVLMAVKRRNRGQLFAADMGTTMRLARETDECFLSVIRGWELGKPLHHQHPDVWSFLLPLFPNK